VRGFRRQKAHAHGVFEKLVHAEEHAARPAAHDRNVVQLDDDPKLFFRIVPVQDVREAAVLQRITGADEHILRLGCTVEADRKAMTGSLLKEVAELLRGVRFALDRRLRHHDRPVRPRPHVERLRRRPQRISLGQADNNSQRQRGPFFQ